MSLSAVRTKPKLGQVYVHCFHCRGTGHCPVHSRVAPVEARGHSDRANYKVSQKVATLAIDNKKWPKHEKKQEHDKVVDLHWALQETELEETLADVNKYACEDHTKEWPRLGQTSAIHLICIPVQSPGVNKGVTIFLNMIQTANEAVLTPTQTQYQVDLEWYLDWLMRGQLHELMSRKPSMGRRLATIDEPRTQRFIWGIVSSFLRRRINRGKLTSWPGHFGALSCHCTV